jgi:hypothetical protein
LKNGRGEIIDHKYITLLHELQQTTGLRAGNVDFKKHIIKVNFAARADALDFCMNDLKLPEFQGAGATIEFIKVIDRLFDIDNSRNSIAMRTKGPLSATKDTWLLFVHYSLKYIKELTVVAGVPIYETPRKTSFIAFYISTMSVVNLFNKYINCSESQLSYLLTHKMSQDHLEIIF